MEMQSITALFLSKSCSRTSHRWSEVVCILFCLTSLTCNIMFGDLFMLLHVSVVVPFYCWVIVHCIGYRLFQSFFCGWTPELFSVFDYYSKMSLRYFASTKFKCLSHLFLSFLTSHIWHEYSHVYLYKCFKKMWVYVCCCSLSVVKSSVNPDNRNRLLWRQCTVASSKGAGAWCADCAVRVTWSLSQSLCKHSISFLLQPVHLSGQSFWCSLSHGETYSSTVR